MQDFLNCLFSQNGMAYGTGVLVFLFTLFLVSRRVIGFTLTLLFLIFSLVAAFGVANKDLIRKYFEDLSTGKTAEGTPAPGQASIQDQLQKAYDDLKAEFEAQKNKFQSFIEEQQQTTPEKKPEEPKKE